jgi:hypothetical protein
VIYFKQHRLEVTVKYDVEAEQLKTNLLLIIGWLTSSVIVRQIKLNAQHRFYHNVFYLCLQAINVLALIL